MFEGNIAVLLNSSPSFGLLFEGNKIIHVGIGRWLCPFCLWAVCKARARNSFSGTYFLPRDRDSHRPGELAPADLD
jgi:hypothetical protein